MARKGAVRSAWTSCTADNVQCRKRQIQKSSAVLTARFKKDEGSPCRAEGSGPGRIGGQHDHGLRCLLPGGSRCIGIAAVLGHQGQALALPAVVSSPLIEWHGGLRWVWAPASAAALLRNAAQKAGGHATLFRASASRGDADKAGGVFTPQQWLALDRIATLMKEDRDKNFIAKNRDGVTVNRWLTTGFFATSAQTNEAGYLTYTLMRGLGMVAIETQARI